MSTTDPRAERVLSLIHDADELGFFAAADPALLATLARGFAAETIIGGLPAATTVAEAHHIPVEGVHLLAEAGLAVYFPLSAMARKVTVLEPDAVPSAH